MSIPELDKIVMMSSLFGVSTDYLLKDELSEETPAEGNAFDREEGRLVTVEEANSYMEASKSCGQKIAVAVLMYVASPVLLILLDGMAEAGFMSEGVATAIGLAVLFALIAVATVLCIVFGLRLGKYEYMKKEMITLQYGVKGIVEKKKEAFENKFQTSIAVGVAMIILAIIPLIVAGCMEVAEIIEIYCVCLLLICVALATYLFVTVSYVWGSYQSLLQESDYSKDNKRFNKKFEAFSGAYWCITTAIYLAISFIWGIWHISWVIWPVAGVLFGAISAIARAMMNKTDRE